MTEYPNDMHVFLYFARDLKDEIIYPTHTMKPGIPSNKCMSFMHLDIQIYIQPLTARIRRLTAYCILR